MPEKTQNIKEYSRLPAFLQAWFHPNGQHLLIQSSQTTIDLYNPQLGKGLPPDRILDFEISLRSFSPNQNGATEFAVGLESGEVLRVHYDTFAITKVNKGHKGAVVHLSYSPNGTQLLTIGEDGKIGIHNLQKGKSKQYKIESLESVSSSFWVSEQKVLLACSDYSLHSWAVGKNKSIEAVESHSAAVTCIVRNPILQFIIYSASEAGEVLSLDLSSTMNAAGSSNRLIGHHSPVTGMDISPTGDLLVTVDKSGVVMLWDVRFPGREVLVLSWGTQTPCAGVCWEADTNTGNFFVLHNSGEVKLWENFSYRLLAATQNRIEAELAEWETDVQEFPEWVLRGELEVILPQEVPHLRKVIRWVHEFLDPQLDERYSNPFWVIPSYHMLFDKLRKKEKVVLSNLEKIQKLVKEVEESEQLKKEKHDRLLEEVSSYLQKMQPGSKVSAEQLREHFATNESNILSTLQEIEESKLVVGTLRREIVGWFYEISITSRNNNTSSNSLLCFYCGQGYGKDEGKCPFCDKPTKICEVCRKPIVFRESLANCPSCKTPFHFSCFETKAKFFGRCPKCRQVVDFETMKREVTESQKKQETVSSRLTQMMSLRSQVGIEKEDSDPDDDLFDF